MRRAARVLFRAGALVASAIIVLALALLFAPTRSTVISLALRVAVRYYGFHYAGGRLAYERRVLTIDDLRLNDDRGEEFLTARSLVVAIDPAGLIGRSDRRLGLRAVDLAAPHLFLRHRSDGTWNFLAFAAHRRAPSAAGGAPVPAPSPGWRVHVAIQGGTIDVVDPQAVAAAGKSLRLAHVALSATLDQGAQSSGTLATELQTDRGATAMHGAFVEDDRWIEFEMA